MDSASAQFIESIVNTLIHLLRAISPFLFGLLTGILIRRLIGVALIVLAMFALALVLGYTSPAGIEGVLQGIAAAVYQIVEALGLANVQFSGPMFIAGIIIGLIMGSIKWLELIVELTRRRRRADEV